VLTLTLIIDSKEIVNEYYNNYIVISIKGRVVRARFKSKREKYLFNIIFLSLTSDS
jgi:hypothetical protein